MPTKF